MPGNSLAFTARQHSVSDLATAEFHHAGSEFIASTQRKVVRHDR